jgi:hypothetical protein
MAAFIPGASPPDVKTPTVVIFAISVFLSGAQQIAYTQPLPFNACSPKYAGILLIWLIITRLVATCILKNDKNTKISA